MTRKQMIGVLEDYCNKNICVSCKLHYACESKKDFSDMTDEEMEDYVSDIKEKNTDKTVVRSLLNVKRVRKTNLICIFGFRQGFFVSTAALSCIFYY